MHTGLAVSFMENVQVHKITVGCETNQFNAQIVPVLVLQAREASGMI